MRYLTVLFIFILGITSLPSMVNGTMLESCKKNPSADARKYHKLEIQFYTLCLELTEISDKERATYLRKRGMAYGYQKKFSVALDDLNSAIKLDPNNALLFVSKGLIYVEKRDFKSAFREFAEALDRDPNNHQALLSRGLLYEKLNNDENAKEDFQNAINAGAQHPYLLQKARQYGLLLGGGVNRPGTHILFEIPNTFTLILKDQTLRSSILKYIPKAERLDNWSEIIQVTTTGFKEPRTDFAGQYWAERLKAYAKTCKKSEFRDYNFPNSSFTYPKESPDYPGHFLVESDRVRAGMLFCDGLDTTGMYNTLSPKLNVFFFVKVIETPYRKYVFQYMWRNADKFANFVELSGKLENFIIPTMMGAQVYLEKIP
ncbi:hypothetical protein J0X12_07145 [Sneathiella sp. CAU 1612]|uniref:Tetratricopeptide repeat protein n=1 Tax=Sneathiella sedimenti TaxID=2816034 RepID=A0ABS3F4C0_9PROT|nr:tetratricopeptide repeat protein [Sneathiella sedimenti]MBO0333382.1 hypothetical protein [Sneathiella sedimenti]